MKIRKFCLMTGISVLLLLAACGEKMPEASAEISAGAQESGAALEESAESSESSEESAGEQAEPKESEDVSGEAVPEPDIAAESKIGRRLLSFYQNIIVGEDENGLITILAVDHDLSEDKHEEIIRVISYEDDILYMVAGTDYGNGGSGYTQIRSVGQDGAVIAEAQSYTVWWAGVEDALYLAYYDNDHRGEHLRYRFMRITRDADGGYVSEQVYEELGQAACDRGQDFLAAEFVAVDIAKTGMTYVREYQDGQTARLVQLDENGEEKGSLALASNMSYVDGRTENGVLYSSLDYDNYDVEKMDYAAKSYYLDFGSGETVCLYDSATDGEKPSFIAAEGDRIYYCKGDQSVFEHSVYHIYEYDTAAGKETFLYTREEVPGGKGTYLYGAAGFAVARGECLFLMSEGREICWYRLDAKSGGKPENAGIVVNEYPVLRYGKVTYESETVTADDTVTAGNTGKKAYQYYLEKLQLTTEDAGTEAINAALAERYEDLLKYAKTQAEQAKQTSAVDEYWVNNTYTDYIEAVEEIGSGYYCIRFSGYEYWGGAHGYPYRGSMLFDRETGEERTVKDLYTGTEEEFKDMVARYTVVDWHNEPEKYFGWGNEQEAYESLYENAQFDMSVDFDVDGLIIRYAPYELGSYAAGYIDVKIPYEALGLEFLTE